MNILSDIPPSEKQREGSTWQWWHRATSGVRGVPPHHADVVTFVASQLLDGVAPPVPTARRGEAPGRYVLQP